MPEKLCSRTEGLAAVAVLISVAGVIFYLVLLRAWALGVSHMACHGELRSEVCRAVFFVGTSRRPKVFTLGGPREVAWLEDSLAHPYSSIEKPTDCNALVSTSNGGLFWAYFEFLKWGNRRVVIFEPATFLATLSLNTHWSAVAPMPPSVVRKLRGLWEHQRAFGPYGGF